MNRHLFQIPLATAMVAACVVFGTVSCQRKSGAEKEAAVLPQPSGLESNALGGLPGAVYRSQRDSPIHWQPWTPETMRRAREAGRLIFGVIAMPQQPGFQSVLAGLDGSPEMVAEINDSYVPVLIDGDAAREMGLLNADLCVEIKSAVKLPLLVWMSPEANPIAWIPAPQNDPPELRKVFSHSVARVNRMWREDFNYVLENSARDNAARRERIGVRKNANVVSAQPAEDTLRGIRKLASFFDPDNRSFNEVGGLFPSGSLDLLATAAIHPGVPAEIRERCLQATRDLLADLLPSPMFDPLDGGLFSGRRGKTWTFPTFSRDTVAQARAVVALANASRATGSREALEKALDLIAFCEKSYRTADGLFTVGMGADPDPAAWLWSTEEIRNILPPGDAEWWIRATGMEDLGNLPFEVDPRRTFFRRNSLSLAESMPAIAASLSMSQEAFAPRFEKTRQALLKARDTRLGPQPSDETPHAGASFRMVSAYAAAFAVTGDDAWRAKAVAVLEKCRAAFGEGPRLRNFAVPTENSLGAGRAFLYALAIQAIVDVSTITSDDKWLLWSEDLATTAAELFTSQDYLKECPDAARIVDLPVTDLVMLYDDSTAGLFAFAECRLAARGRPLVRRFSELASPLPGYIVDRPILHTDLMQATLARECGVTVVAGPSLPADLKLAIERLPVRMIQRRAAKPADEVPAGSVKIILGNGESRMVSTVADLQQAVLPSAVKS